MLAGNRLDQFHSGLMSRPRAVWRTPPQDLTAQPRPIAPQGPLFKRCSPAPCDSPRCAPAPPRPAPRPGASAPSGPPLAVGRPSWQRRAVPLWNWGSPAAGRSSPGRAKVGRRPGAAGGGGGGAPALSRAPRRHRAQHGPGAARDGCAGGGCESDPGRLGQPGRRGRRRLVPARLAAGGAGGGPGRAAPGAGADQGPSATLPGAHGLREPPERPTGRRRPLGLEGGRNGCLARPGPEALRRREEMDFRGAVPDGCPEALNCLAAWRPC